MSWAQPDQPFSLLPVRRVQRADEALTTASAAGWPASMPAVRHLLD